MCTAENVIEVECLEFKYGKIRAVDNLSFSLKKGQILGFIGMNGAGKTTTIHLLLGLLRYHKGRISVLGEDPKVNNLGILNNCGFFPEQGNPYEWMKVSDLFKMGSHCFKSWDGIFCKELYEQLNLDISKRISDLSRGMLIKAKMIFCLSHRPDILIFDEPTNGLDPLSRFDVMEKIRELATQHNVSVLISSHNLDEIADIATQICIINNGTDIFSASMDSINTKYGILESGVGEKPEGLAGQILCSRKLGVKTQFLITDIKSEEMQRYSRKHSEEITLRNINLKELFVFITRDA